MEQTQNIHNRQKTGEENQRTPSELRNDMLQIALSMRLRGMRYELISNALKDAGYKAKETTVRDWFAVNGDLHAAYMAERQKRLEELQKDLADTQDQLKEAALDALGLLREGMATGLVTKGQMAIAQDILDRAGYAKTIKTDNKVESDSMTEVAKGIKSILERK